MKHLAIFWLLLLLFSCTTKKKEKPQSQSNLLVDELITVSHLYSEQAQQSLPWTNAFRVRTLINSLFFDVLQNKIVLYNPIFEDTVFNKLDKESWLHILKNSKHLTFDTTQFNDLFFFESWHLDTLENFNLRKEVLYWSPVKRENQIMKLAGKVKTLPLKEKKLLAQQLIYEFSLNDSIFANERLNKRKFAKILFEWAIHNPQKTYNPFTSQPMTKEELYKRMYISDSSLYMPHNDINSILFVENWYYDTKTYSIQKEVLSIAPILYLYNDDEVSKQILFVIHPNNKPFKIL